MEQEKFLVGVMVSKDSGLDGKYTFKYDGSSVESDNNILYVMTEKELSDEEKEAFLNEYDPSNKENYTFMFGYNTFNLNYIYVNITERDDSYLLICKEKTKEDTKEEEKISTPIYVRSGHMSFSYKEKDAYVLSKIF